MKLIRSLPVTLALTLLLAACGQSTTSSAASPESEVISAFSTEREPAPPSAAVQGPQDTLRAQSFETTWAGGRCWFRQSYTSGNGHHFEVKHHNNGYVRLHVKLISWNMWEKFEQRYHVGYTTNWAAEVYAYCKVDGQWVGGMKYRTN